MHQCKISQLILIADYSEYLQMLILKYKLIFLNFISDLIFNIKVVMFCNVLYQLTPNSVKNIFNRSISAHLLFLCISLFFCMISFICVYNKLMCWYLFLSHPLSSNIKPLYPEASTVQHPPLLHRAHHGHCCYCSSLLLDVSASQAGISACSGSHTGNIIYLV